MGLIFLREIYLSQIKQANFLNWSLRFKHLLLQDPFIYALIYLLVFYIMNSKINIIIINPKFKLTSNNINLKAFEYFSFEAI